MNHISPPVWCYSPPVWRWRCCFFSEDVLAQIISISFNRYISSSCCLCFLCALSQVKCHVCWWCFLWHTHTHTQNAAFHWFSLMSCMIEDHKWHTSCHKCMILSHTHSYSMCIHLYISLTTWLIDASFVPIEFTRRWRLVSVLGNVVVPLSTNRWGHPVHLWYAWMPCSVRYESMISL